jgi:hypothetical protein
LPVQRKYGVFSSMSLLPEVIQMPGIDRSHSQPH